MRWTGTWQVIQFNWPKLLGGVAAVGAGALVAGSRAPRIVRIAGGLGAAAAAWTTVASMVGTWWVYDASELRHWRFPARVAGRTPSRILLVSAGFDEVSAPLAQAFPSATIEVVDMLDEEAAEEASIRRARRLYPSSARRVSPDDVAGDDRFDLVLLAQSAHELRAHHDRVRLVRSSLEALEPGGAVVLVEHLRDAANAVIYGPGALHFHSAETWRAAVKDAGGRIDRAERITPFVAAWAVRPR